MSHYFNHMDLDAVGALIQGVVLFQRGNLMDSQDKNLISGSGDELQVVSRGKVVPFHHFGSDNTYFFNEVRKNLWSNVGCVLWSHQVPIVTFQIGPQERHNNLSHEPLHGLSRAPVLAHAVRSHNLWRQSDKQVVGTPRRTPRGSTHSAHTPGRPGTSCPCPGPIRQPSRAFSGQRTAA